MSSRGSRTEGLAPAPAVDGPGASPRSRAPLPRSPELALPERFRREIIALARRAHPREACGLLLGSRSRDGRRAVVAELHAARNLADARAALDSFELDPADHLAAELRAARLGLAVVGVWHSHPDRPAVPSEADRAAAFAGWSWLIAAVAGEGRAELRSFRPAKPGPFAEERIVEGGEAGSPQGIRARRGDDAAPS